MRLAELEEQISQLLELRDSLTQLRDQADDIEPETCTANQVCRYL
jgi:hypothetical protein